MKETFLVLLTAHLVGDFLFQNNWMVKTKDKNFWCLLLHAGIVTVLTIFFAAYFQRDWSLLIYPCVFLAHLSIDWIKKLAGRNGIYAFLADQIAHIVVLCLIARAIPEIAQNSLWLGWMCSGWYFKSLVFISGLVGCVFAGGILISKATKPLVDQIEDSTGLKNGGKWIGQLERALTFFFMLTGQTSAIGFLFAAKSILRFSEIKDPDQRKEAEYIIIGTFMSFGWALLIAYLTKQALGLWPQNIVT